MEAAQEPKKHPGYVEAIDRILERFDAGGYGIIITDEEFDSYMSISAPPGPMTYAAFKALEMERLQKYRAMELLLEQHNICLMRSKAVAGFELLPPKEQVDIAYQRRMGKMMRELKKAQAALLNVNHELLTMEEEADRQKKITRLAFIRCATNKRKIPIAAVPEAKKLSA